MPLTEPKIHASVWRKARRSMSNGDCVEVAPANGKIFIRDSKNPEGPVLGYPVSEWRKFLASAKLDNSK
jgi:hypothetical protein